MIEPLSLSAVAAALGAVSAGVANEVGKAAWESAGALVRRLVGRDVQAPSDSAGRDLLAGLLTEEARRDPQRARALRAWVASHGHGWAGPLGTPKLLPPSARFFTDRRTALALLDREAGRRHDGRPRVCVLCGPQGIGTSALAIHWGSREFHRFPDGQLYADLSGGSLATAPDPGTVLRRFLVSLGVPEARVPPLVQDRVELFRSLLADRRLLVVLDHAQSAAQVRPLITQAPGVVTLVTSRRPLLGLDAVAIAVEPLTDKDAKRLLTDLAGKAALSAARATLPAVLERCAGSPFALRAAAPRLASVPRQAVVGGRTRGDEGGDPVRTAVRDMVADLGPDEGRVFRLCGLRPWPAVGPAVAAAVSGLTEERAAEALANLAERGLLEPTPAGRYRYRSTVRQCAEEEAARVDGIAACVGAVARVVDCFLRFAVPADFAALPERWHVGPLYDELGPGRYEEPGQAVSALLEEVENLVEAVLAAEAIAAWDEVCQLVEACWAVQLKAGCHEVLMPGLRAGARVAEQRFPGTAMAGRMNVQLAFGLMESGLLEEAEPFLIAGVSAFERAGHRLGQAAAVEALGLLRLRQWRWQPAYDCFEEADRLLGSVGPDDKRARDVPRAAALLKRHRGRALRGLGEFDRARTWFDEALAYFRDSGDDYNAARTLTNLAETWADTGRTEEALARIGEAEAILSRHQADLHLRYLTELRERCLTERA
ncbi:tetratricopeptide repeat protein [Kitasatospora sp. NPDC091335]|uniref:tetratricopeptide repeat protein n=1 Tax=Kitasatospora sp. NPDC091335 TaxID=3364085 RepID=UPI0037F13A8E